MPDIELQDLKFDLLGFGPIISCYAPSIPFRVGNVYSVPMHVGNM